MQLDLHLISGGLIVAADTFGCLDEYAPVLAFGTLFRQLPTTLTGASNSSGFKNWAWVVFAEKSQLSLELGDPTT